MTIYTVKSGDTLYEIGRQFGVTAAGLASINGLVNPERLIVGQAIVILKPQKMVVAAQGDTVNSIAAASGITPNQLYRNNPQILHQGGLYPGMELVTRYEGERLGSMETLGYAYPYVDLQVLREAMPYMTYLVPFTYEIGEQNMLIPINDGPLIDVAGEFGVSSLMSLSNLREPEGFLGSLASRVLNDLQAQRRIIDQTLETIRRKGYTGVDVDFEYVYAADRVAYADFLRRLGDALHPEGYVVFAALAAKTSSQQQDVLSAGHDYRLVGEVADGVLLMTYEWGYSAGPPMAVSPINNIRQVLDYAVGEMPADKILMGIANYGYDWPLPYVAGQTRGRAISNNAALDIAAAYGAAIQYSETSQAPFFHYVRDGVHHEVWFENARSIQAKLALVKEYGLKGAGYWNLMFRFQANWSVLNAMYHIKSR
nr:glycosyl hydrolase family 18 protein [bacterium]